MTARGATATACAALLLGCAAAPRWQDDLPRALADARAAQREIVVFFALRGRVTSDRMEESLPDSTVGAALADGAFDAVVADGKERARLCAEWVGGPDGMGVAVLDAAGRRYAARPGPQDPPELAAFLRRCAASRGELARLSAAVAAAPAPTDQHALGCLLLELGNVRDAEPLLLAAATAGVADSRHRLARLCAQDGDLTRARQWLATAPRTPAARVTEGYVLFKEKKARDAATVLDAALRDGGLGGDRQRAALFLGKALHDAKDDARAVQVLEALASEGTGSTFEAAARHTLSHVRDGGHRHDS
ncbi:MAG: tetratricopeptide repeat protein [Planctomycetes bacterium]|nr:tetratricopeptide repeat protein [Planctomycetota bacterium]